MTEHSPAGPDLDTRLAELDRRLREIQADLVGDGAPPDDTPSAAEPSDSPRLEPDPPGPGPEPDPLAGAAPEPRPLAGPGPELAPEPAPPRPDPPRPEPPPPLTARDVALRPPIGHGRSGPLADLLAHLQARPDDFQGELSDLKVLLSDLHETLDGIEEVLDRLAAGAGKRRSARETAAPETATIAAGPFTTIDSVRAFERELTLLPGVREASVRGYEGAARAIIDVHFGEDH